ncbi:FLX-like protein [Rhynchospora pubera]|uniref:FLX-like protein n=1 Tax=Rhynchospora pubera TaxID=906938 RepID=A0AAV8FI19_9POAL|nr:FLX-like protein [Rhynchospora pubera]
MSLRGHIPARLERHVPARLEGRQMEAPGLLRHDPFPRPVPSLHHRHQADPTLPPHRELLERKVSFQFNEMERLARENARLAESHTAMRQEIAASQKEVDAIQAHLAGVRSEIDIQIMGVFEKIKNFETEIRMGETMQVELHRAQVEAQALTAAREELRTEMRQLGEELERCSTDNRKLHDMYKELDGLRQEHQKLRSTFEYEKGTNIRQVEQMQGMEKNLMSMAKEVEKLRADIANAEKRIQQATQNTQYQNPAPMYHQPSATYQQPPVQAVAYGSQGYGQPVAYPHSGVYSYSVPQYSQAGPTVYQNPYAPAQNPAAGVMATDGTTVANHYASSTAVGYTVPVQYGGGVTYYDPSGEASASAAGKQG